MRYIQDLIKSSIKTERVEGFKKLVKSGLRLPQAKIIAHQAFLFYKKQGMKQPLQKEIEAVFFTFRKKYPKRGFYVGRAYSVPGFKNPPGPYSVVRTAKGMVKGVIKLYDFALENKYDQKGARIGVITHPWIDPKAPLGGGCVVLSQDRFKKIIIEAIYGLDEGVQSLPHDVYLVDFKKDKILEKMVVKKKECLEADREFNVRTVKVAKKWQKKPVLKDEEVFQVSRDFRKFIKIHGPHRLEFGFEKDGPWYRECIPFILKKERLVALKLCGRVKRIITREDLEEMKEKIIFIDPSVVKKRKFNFLTSLATQSREKKIILYPGSTTTGHTAIIFREAGHIVVYVGNEIFDDGEEVLIKTKNGEPVVRRIKE